MHEFWERRIARVREHIAAHPAGDLSLDAMADLAALSRFHFHRVWAAMMGETLAETVRRDRLNRAAVLAGMTATPMTRIARSVGYPNLQSFQRAFRQAFGETPAAIRRARKVPVALIPKARGELPMYDVRIEAAAPAVTLAALPHRGPYQAIGPVFGALMQRLAQAGMADRIRGAAYGLYYDDPSTVPAADLRAHAGIMLSPGPWPEGMDRVEIPGGRLAVLTHRGPFEGLPTAWSWIYGQWLPNSGEKPADRVPYERYPEPMDEANPANNLAEICVPLE